MKLLIYLLFFALNQEDVICTISVATYNIWNIMFNWDIRSLRISRLIKESKADIVALQEVRQSPDGAEGQLSDMRQLLAEYKYSYFAYGHDTVDNKLPNTFQVEGTAVLSKHPIVEPSVKNLTYRSGPDKNKRTVLLATVRHPVEGDIHLAVVHLSYYRQQQCDNVAELLLHLKNIVNEKVIIMGDFNTYIDYEGPMRLLTDAKITDNNPCQRYLKRRKDIGLRDFSKGMFQDVWTSSHSPSKPGYTFSNMPEPGLQSRPDRILVSQQFQVFRAQLSGNGRTYKRRFFGHVVITRFWNLISAMYDNVKGVTQRGCMHDCGPHASCRCNICVAGGNVNSCSHRPCTECEAFTFKILIALSVAFIFAIFMFFTAFIRILSYMNHKSGKSCLKLPFCETLYSWCCLLDANLYCIRTKEHSGILRKVPPVVQLLISVILLCLILQFTLVMLGDVIKNINAILPEELFPSDHLMLVAELR